LTAMSLLLSAESVTSEQNCQENSRGEINFKFKLDMLTSLGVHAIANDLIRQLGVEAGANQKNHYGWAGREICNQKMIGARQSI
jgi:hypothetical protein